MGSHRALAHEAIFAIGFNEQTFAADVTIDGATFDLADADGGGNANAAHEFIALVDTGLWVDGTHLVRLEDSPDDVTFTTVGADDVIVGSPLTGIIALQVSGGVLTIDSVVNDNSQYIFAYMGAERYVRLSVESTATTTGLADVVAWYVGANPRDNVR